jgi:hypothetical protein
MRIVLWVPEYLRSQATPRLHDPQEGGDGPNDSHRQGTGCPKRNNYLSLIREMKQTSDR